MKLKLLAIFVFITGLFYALRAPQDASERADTGVATPTSHDEQEVVNSGPSTSLQGPLTTTLDPEEQGTAHTVPSVLKAPSQPEITSKEGEALKEVLGVGAELNADNATDLDDTSKEGDGESDEMVFSTDREGVKSAVAEMNEQIRECYHGWRQSNPELKGRVVLAFTISPPEDPSDERSIIEGAQLLVDNLAHPMMSACLLNSAQGLQFEAVQSKITVHYPYHFSAGASGP